jgi:hypothetical protein
MCNDFTCALIWAREDLCIRVNCQSSIWAK